MGCILMRHQRFQSGEKFEKKITYSICILFVCVCVCIVYVTEYFTEFCVRRKVNI